MSVYSFLDYWLFVTQVWLIAGVILVLLELLDGSSIFFLPLGVSAFAIALMLEITESDLIPLNWVPTTWYQILIIFSFMGVLFAYIFGTIRKLRKYRRHSNDTDDPDINEY